MHRLPVSSPDLAEAVCASLLVAADGTEVALAADATELVLAGGVKLPVPPTGRVDAQARLTHTATRQADLEAHGMVAEGGLIVRLKAAPTPLQRGEQRVAEGQRSE